MNNDSTKYQCATCGKPVQMGPNLWEGQWNRTYRITVCHSCHAGNGDGWAPHLEARVTQVLLAEAKQLPPRNSDHLLPRE
jgi:DNA-directed RNA polymerase subunit RPC12/RpoP